MNVAENSILDLNVLEQYCELIGSAVLLKSVVLFETQATDYLSNMNEAFQQNEESRLVSEAHKLKGAAGSIGLKRIQQLAECLQRNDREEWQAQHSHWLAEINNYLTDDTEQLKTYLAK